ncbi:MAG: phosphatase PAP2 family protein [Planctomycetes bacterium]|nr:phosphatase PAP2 family protein [Planctomycetota bacterium]
MTEAPPPPAPFRPLPLLAILIPTLALVFGSFALPPVRGDGWLAEAAYWVSFTGKEGLAGVAFLGSALVVSGVFQDWRDRGRWALAGLLTAALVVGGGALFNEYAIKRTLAVPRPFVKRLAKEGVLGMTPEAFYGLGDKEARREHLRKVLTPEVTPDLSERLRSHWVVETGYSFPSGHSYAAASCAALFVAWGLLAGVGGWRRIALAGLLPWGVAVCYSRPLLGVHSPTDVSAGCAMGFAFGAGAACLLWRASREAQARANSPAGEASLAPPTVEA